MDEVKTIYYRSSRTGNLFKRRLATCFMLDKNGEWVENPLLFGDLIGGDLAYDKIDEEEANKIIEERRRRT